MKTIDKTIPHLYAAETPGHGSPPVPARTVRCHFVQFETIEMPMAEFEATTFHILDVGSNHAERIGRLLCP